MAFRPKTIRIAVADSNQMASRLLSEALGKQLGLSVVASDVDSESLLRSVQALKPDITVISAALPDGPFSRKVSVDETRRSQPATVPPGSLSPPTANTYTWPTRVTGPSRSSRSLPAAALCPLGRT